MTGEHQQERTCRVWVPTVRDAFGAMMHRLCGARIVEGVCRSVRGVFDDWEICEEKRDSANHRPESVLFHVYDGYECETGHPAEAEVTNDE